jgi:hypothetical protein
MRVNKQELQDDLTGSMPECVILKVANSLDPATPIGRPLKVTGWGRSSSHVNYDLPGWDQIAAASDEYYIVSCPLSSYVVRTSTGHEKFFAEEHIIRTLDQYGEDEEDEEYY